MPGSLGVIELCGTASKGNPMASLITHVPSYISRVVVEEDVESRGTKRWQKIHTQEPRVPFYLDDGTGAVKVNPQVRHFCCRQMSLTPGF